MTDWKEVHPPSDASLFGVREDDKTGFVALTDEEFDGAVAAGTRLWERSQEYGFREKIADPEKSKKAQQLQMITERAAAKYLGLNWNAEGFTFKGPDLSHNVEVRTIGVANYALRVYESDVSEKRVMGVVCPKGVERDPLPLPGWITAGEAREVGTVLDPGNRGLPFFAVPQRLLRPIMELREIVQQEET